MRRNPLVSQVRRHATSLRPRLLASAVAFLVTAIPALGQGRILLDDPVSNPRRPGGVTSTPFELKYQRVTAVLRDGVATVTLKQTFRNPLGVPVEGTYVMPLPDDIAVSDFSMTIGGKTLKGEVLDADQARRTYESIVRRVRDPGLLELLGNRVYRVKIFPVPARQLAEVELRYTQTIAETAGMGRLLIPLRGDLDGPPIEEVSVDLQVSSHAPLASVFCPTHAAEVTRPDDQHARVSFEQARYASARDMEVFYQRRDSKFGCICLTHRAAGEDGYFFLRISPPVEIPDREILPKDIAFVVDTSGSMQGDKLAQTKRALRFCIDSLNPDDRFNIYAFSTEVRPFRAHLEKAAPELKEAARDYADRLEAAGGTNIHAALMNALENDPQDERRPYLIVFMTDGVPTVEVTDPAQILKHVGQRNSRSVRFHVLGVGSDINSNLLDKLAEMNRGSRDYVLEKEDLELKLSAMVGRLSKPVLTDLELQIDGVGVHDVYPKQLPDLFDGGEIVVMGRYDADGKHDIRLTGTLRDARQVFSFAGDFPRTARENDFLPRLWATRKVAYLLDEIRLHGQVSELRDEIVRLATRHGIVTPYTAALILEDEGQIANAQPAPPRRSLQRAAGGGGRFGGGDVVSGGDVVGGGGGGRAGSGAASRELKDAKQRERLEEAEAAPGAIRHIAEKTFVRDGERYVDTAWDGKAEPERVEAFGDRYFALLDKFPELAKFLTLGDRLVVVIADRVIEIVPSKD